MGRSGAARGMVAALGFALAATSRTAGAQALAGRVIDAATRCPMRGVTVQLVASPSSDSTLVATAAVVSTTTAEDGAFMLLAPRPGTYRARIGEQFLSVPVVLSSPAAYVEQEYVVPGIAPGVDTLAPAGAAEPARILPGPAIRELSRLSGYRMPANRVRVWHATVEVVVDSAGHPEPATVRVVSATTEDFGEAARRYMLGSSFIPARLNGRPVRQLTQMPVFLDLQRAPAQSLPPDATLRGRRASRDVSPP